MTKLQAVNEMLESLGVAPVTALDTNGTTEEAEAETILDRYTDRVLSMGWSCNTADEREFAVSGGEIDMSGVYSFTMGKYGDDYAIKDGKLYDPVNDTSTFTANVSLRHVVFSLTFTQIPDHVARLIVAEAVMAFVRYKKQDIAEDRRYAAMREEAMRHAKSVDAQISNVNIFQTDEAYLARGYPYGRR